MTRRILVWHSYLHSNKKTIYIYTCKKVFIIGSNLSANIEIKTVDELCSWKENINTALVKKKLYPEEKSSKTPENTHWR